MVVGNITMSVGIVVAAVVGLLLGVVLVVAVMRTVARRREQVVVLDRRVPAAVTVPTGWQRAARPADSTAARVEGAAPAMTRSRQLDARFPTPTGGGRPVVDPAPPAVAAPPAGSAPLVGSDPLVGSEPVVDARPGDPRPVEDDSPSPVRVAQIVTAPRRRKQARRQERIGLEVAPDGGRQDERPGEDPLALPVERW